VFEIGGSHPGNGGSKAHKGGVSGAFFTGLLAGFVGAPCVGPFMAPAVGVALTQPAPMIVLVFVVIGVGLAAPLVLLSFTPAFAKIIPKPGRWMETFRQVLAFPMFLTALWLLWVLSAQAGADGVLAVLAGAIVLGFGIWLARRFGQGLVGRIVAAAMVIGGFAAAPILMNLPKEELLVEEQPWSPQQVTALRSEGRAILVDFTATWCITCQVNKSTTLKSSGVQKVMADTNTAFLVADWTNKDKVIGEELARHGAAGIPFYLIYPASGGEPLKFDGLLTPGQIEQAIREAAGSI
jgi:thiol:disulfide interchange protein DsbD